MLFEEGNDCQEFISKVLKETGGSVEGMAEWILDQVRSGKIENLRKIYMCFIKDSGSKSKFPDFERSGKVTKNALVLIILYLAFKSYSLERGSPWVMKSILNQLTGSNDAQQPRHLTRKGFKIISSDDYKDYQKYTLPSGVVLPPPPPSKSPNDFWYVLTDLKRGDPSPHREIGVKAEEFEEIKKAYKYRCATCGAEEGKPHYNPHYARKEIVKLQRAHMNPLKELKPGNIIPQCQFCNRAYRNWLVFDRNGRTIGVANWVFVIHSLKNGYLSGEIPPDFWEIIRKAAKQRLLDQDLKGGSE